MRSLIPASALQVLSVALGLLLAAPCAAQDTTTAAQPPAKQAKPAKPAATKPVKAAPARPAVDPRAEYGACMKLARDNPEGALKRAKSWQAAGGAAARHCAAVALIGMEQYSEAALELEAISEEVRKEKPEIAADLMAQAGQAWVMDKQPDKALAAQNRALEMEPENPDFLVDRGLTLAQSGKYWEAIDDFNAAQERAPKRPDIYIFRGTAYRFLETYDLAMDDIQQALDLSPNSPEALLERGVLRRLTKDPEGARMDWLQVVTLAPNTPMAEAAQANLERLDVKTE